MSRVSIRAAQHMEGFLSPETRAKRIKGALAVIKFREKHHGDIFDAIAYRGASGAITASIIAHQLKKPLILVRKPEDTKGHSPYLLEGPTKVHRYLIVDDFMSSGRTYEAIREAVSKEHPHAICIGMLEVTYCENGGCDKKYRFSREHEDQIERDKRLVVGKATKADVEWVTRAQPLPPNVVYRTVGIVREGDKYSFDFERNRQKLLVADTAPKRDFADVFNEWTKIFFAPLQNIAPQTVAEPAPEVDGVDLYNTINPFSNFFYNPVKYRMSLAASEPVSTSYEQKAQTPPEAAVSAAAAG